MSKVLLTRGVCDCLIKKSTTTSAKHQILGNLSRNLMTLCDGNNVNGSTSTSSSSSSSSSSNARTGAADRVRFLQRCGEKVATFHQTSFQGEAKRDYYKVLGISQDAPKNEIKKQYYKMAKKYHPDSNKADPEAAKKFAEATEAWEILGDDEKRGQYDSFGHAGVDPNGGGFDGSGFGGGGFEDIFSMFGGGQQQQRKRSRNQPQRGADIQMNTRISFMEAVNGTTRELNIVSNVECGTCHGSGAKPGTSASKCRKCNGSGTQTIQQGFFAIETPCSACQGQGSKIESPCGTCYGIGTVKKPRKVSVTIPEGVDHGMNLRLGHQGEAGVRGGPAGHLYLGIEVQSDPFFKREGTDIHVEMPISLAQACLGGTVTMPTLTGEVELKIPKGTQPDTTLKLKGKGIKRLNSYQRGSQLVMLKVQVPKTLSPKQEELMKAFSEEEKLRGQQGTSDCQSHSFGDTVRDTIHRISSYLHKSRTDDNKKTSQA